MSTAIVFVFLAGLAQASKSQGPAGCSVDAFTLQPAEHIVNKLAEPVHVRAVKGTIRSEVGPWPKEAEVRFELVPVSPEPTRRSVVADRQGGFTIPDVKPGEYCFRASAVGWQSIFGRLVVSPANPRRATIRLTLKLGV